MPQPPKNKPVPLPKTERTIGESIAFFRKKRGYSQRKLGKIIGVSQKQLTSYETNKVHINEEMIVRLCMSLNISSDRLLGLSTAQFEKGKPALRITKRLQDIENLPEIKKRAILKTLDDLIRANS